MSDTLHAFRHEIKIYLSYAEYLILRPRLTAAMTADCHMTDPGGYQISSLYFDDMYDTAYYEKLDGVSRRSKYRIRIYKQSLNKIHLEKKEKINNRILKTSIAIDLECYNRLKMGDCSLLLNRTEELAQEVAAKIQSQLLRPVIIVDYLREAYTHPLSNVRITFDKEVSAGLYSFDFLSEDLRYFNVFPNKEVILEVKYDQYIPTYISRMIQSAGAPQALSKYVFCRDIQKQLCPSQLSIYGG